MPNPERWLTLRDVSQATSLCPSTIYKLIRGQDFPPPVKVGSASRWFESDVTEWMSRKCVARQARAAA